MQTMQKVLLTGATSFTGAYIARALLDQGFSVLAPLQSSLSDYTDLKRERLDLIPEAIFSESTDLNSSKFLSCIEENKPDIFINHAFDTYNYRSPDYDVHSALKNSTGNISQIIKTLKDNNCKLFIHSGSSFEPGGYSQYGVSPYGVAKKMAWDLIAFYCQMTSLPCLKIYIPNPYGYLENTDRLLPILKQKIEAKETFILSSPYTIRNNIKVESLSGYYVQAAQITYHNQLIQPTITEIHPVGYLEQQIDFVYRATQEYPYQIAKDILKQYLQIKV